MEGEIDSPAFRRRLSGLLGPLSQLTRGRQPIFQIWIEKQPVKITNEIATYIQEYWRSDYHDYGTDPRTFGSHPRHWRVAA